MAEIQTIGKNIEVNFANPFKGVNLDFRIATKTKPIKAKPFANVISDKNVLTKFLLQTLEGNQNIREGEGVICLGELGDVWQQKSNKLLQKYNVTAITEDGWLVCEPKPENEVWAAQYDGSAGSVDNKFSIFAQWGEKQPDGQHIQTGQVGDYILTNKNDPNDVWIVRESFYLSTYEFKQ